MKSRKRLLVLLFGLFLVCDAGYSFLQFYTTPLDGDMSESVVPSWAVEEVLTDPFGFNAIANNTVHQNPNRYFSHLFFRDYFQRVPLLLQRIMTPVESVYVSAAIGKLLIQLLMIFLIAVLISRKRPIFSFDLLLVVVLLTPLFQTYGYNRFMGVIDQASTYSFFYALPLLLLLLFFVLLYPAIFQREQQQLSYPVRILLITLIIVLPFSGPLIPPVVLIISLLLFAFYLKEYFTADKNERSIKAGITSVPKAVYFYLVPLAALSLYSLWLGTYNSMSQTDVLPLLERYGRIPNGIFRLVSQKLGYPVLFIMLSVNIFLIKKGPRTEQGKMVITSLKWIGLFSLLYILLLPLGGYRSYRANILRYDTIMPVTLCLFYVYGATSYYLLNRSMAKKQAYIFTLIAVVLIFTAADLTWLDDNKCEKQTLILLSESKEEIFPIGSDCKVVSWRPIYDYKESRLNAEMLHLWNITDELRLYYNE